MSTIIDEAKWKDEYYKMVQEQELAEEEARCRAKMELEQEANTKKTYLDGR